MPRISSTKATFAVAALLLVGTGDLIRAQSDPVLSAEDARNLAQEAWVFGLPLVFTDAVLTVRANYPPGSARRAPVNQFVHYRKHSDLATLSMNVLTVDTLWSAASINLAAEPLVLSVPDMGDRYWSMWLVDAWNNIPQSFGTRTQANEGGHFILVGPNWNGPIPTDLIQLRMPTALAILFARVWSSDESGSEVVHALQDQFKLVPLSKWRTNYSPPPAPREDVKTELPVQDQVLAMSPEMFFGRLNALLVENPPEPPDPATMGRIARLGIRPGGRFDFAALSPEAQRAVHEGMKAGQKEMQNVDIGEPVNRWRYALDMGRFGTNYPYRAYRTFLGVGGTSAEDGIDPFVNQDADGKPLDGANRYVLKFSKDELPPVNFMWSITLYDQEGFFVPNAVDRYSIQSSSLSFDADGSLSIFIQSDAPGQSQSLNWLPAPTKGGFALVMRLYGPKIAVLDGTWKPPALQRVP
jgi:hypothetical protein